MADRHNKIIYTKGINTKNRTVTAVVSTGSVDRDGEIVLPTAVMSHADEFMKNPVVTWSHQTRMPPVGKVVRMEQVGNAVEADIQFADATTMAKEIWSLYKGGFLNAFSIGFRALNLDTQPSEAGQTGPTFHEIELFEIACVTVPANREALVKALDEGVVDVSEDLKKLAFGEYSELADDGDEDTKEPTFTEIEEVVETEEVAEEKSEDDDVETKKVEAELSDELEAQISQLIGEVLSEEEKAPMVVQTLIFSKKMFKNADACKKWAIDHEFRSDKVDETGNSFRLRQRDPGDFDKDSFRTKCLMDMPESMADEAHKCSVAGVFGKLKKEASDTDVVDKNAVRYHRYPLAPIVSSWSFSADDGNKVIERGGWELYRDIHAWWDQSAANGGPPEIKSAYKLPHHKMMDGMVKTVFRGVVAATQRLFQSGTTIPDADRRQVYNHLAKHYLEFDREAPDFKEWTDVEFKAFCLETYNVDLNDRDFKELPDSETIRKQAVAEILNRVNLIISFKDLSPLDENSVTLLTESAEKLYKFEPAVFISLLPDTTDDKTALEEKVKELEDRLSGLSAKKEKALKAIRTFIDDCGGELTLKQLSHVLEIVVLME